MLGTFALLATIAAFGHCSTSEMRTTCPHEVNHLNIHGYRALSGDCVTLVSRQQLQIKANDKLTNKTEFEEAKRYCETEFNLGSLVLHHTKLIDDLNLTDLLSDQNTDDYWTAFSCLHKPYADCLLLIQKECIMVESGSCTWKYKVDSFVPEEPPYGRGCHWTAMETRACKCPPCQKTQWDSWKEHKTADGQTFRTRYRPHDKTPFHSCLSDTKFCCAEFLIAGNSNDTGSVGCQNGGLMSDDVGLNCNCPMGYTGIFCELEAVDSYNINLFSKMTNNDSKLLMWLLMFSILLTVLLSIHRVIKCFQFSKKRTLGYVIVNLNDQNQTEQNDSTENRCVDDDETSTSVNRFSIPCNRISRLKPVLTNYQSQVCCKNRRDNLNVGTTHNEQRQTKVVASKQIKTGYDVYRV